MSEDQQKTADPTSLFGDDDEQTAEQLLGKQYVSDADLSMKTEVREPMVLTVIDMMQHVADAKNYSKTAELLKVGLRMFRENMVSYKRMGRQEFKDTWVAVVDTNMRKKESLGDQIFGGSKR